MPNGRKPANVVQSVPRLARVVIAHSTSSAEAMSTSVSVNTISFTNPCHSKIRRAMPPSRQSSSAESLCTATTSSSMPPPAGE